VLLDLEEDDGRSNQQAANKQSPAGGELGHKGSLFCIQAAKIGDVSGNILMSSYTPNQNLPPHSCSTSRLNSLVETCEVR
jgi:hypothetical protein